MNTGDIKSELRQLIEQETDHNVLEAIRTLLVKSTLDPLLKQKLSSRAAKSERDIENGNVFSRNEAEERLKGKYGA